MEAVQQKEIIHTSEHLELQKLSHISEGKKWLFVSFFQPQNRLCQRFQKLVQIKAFLQQLEWGISHRKDLMLIQIYVPEVHVR